MQQRRFALTCNVRRSKLMSVHSRCIASLSRRPVFREHVEEEFVVIDLQRREEGLQFTRFIDLGQGFVELRRLPCHNPNVEAGVDEEGAEGSDADPFTGFLSHDDVTKFHGEMRKRGLADRTVYNRHMRGSVGVDHRRSLPGLKALQRPGDNQSNAKLVLAIAKARTRQIISRKY
jgi:hypothetical protein